ncbi:MAG: GntR family transcriptional regulator [Muribaculaceae bacterium]|nr:GntR family transcriptional regulator [Muribaculaceae bacterium]MBR3101510.1 GntR family transcriptional regulator [Muribaculaceae bacterium]
MDFKENKAIYLQIADYIGDNILSGKLAAEERVPSVREMAAEIEVNPNTVARTYELLQQQGVIYTRRGLGYFVTPQAREAIMQERRHALMQGELDYFLNRLSAVGIKPDELKQLYENYVKGRC